MNDSNQTTALSTNSTNIEKNSCDERVSAVEEDVSSDKGESDDTPTDFFNLKNSKKASLLSLIQGYREEDVDEGEEIAEHYGSSAGDQEVRDTRPMAGPSTEQPTANRNGNYLPGYTLKLPEHQPLTWNPVNRGFIKQKTSLSTYKW